MNWIAKNISETRKIKGLTQEELAELAKLNLRTIQRIENSESEPRGKTLDLICEALEINPKELLLKEKPNSKKNIGTKIVNTLFLVVLNMVLMGIIGFLTLDSNANINSLFGACLLSVFIPFFLIIMSKKMNGLERMFKFGLGYIIYFALVLFKHGFPTGFVTGFFPCIVISLVILYFGNEIIKIIE